MSRRPVLARAAVPLFAVALLLTACGDGVAASSAPIPTATDVNAVKVTGEIPNKPTITVPTPFSVKETKKIVLIAGTGAQAKAGERVTIDYVGLNGTDGKEFDSSYAAKDATGASTGAKSPSFILDDAESLPGLVRGIVGSTVGSRLLLAIPPADGYGVTGQSQVGIGPNDTLVIVVDIKSTKTVLPKATGTAIAAKSGLPTVKLADNGKPTIGLPSGNPPAALVIQPLIAGTGDKVTKGQQITVHYTGVIWPGGKQFDSSWERGKPSTFPIGQGQVIAGWDEGLVGQAIGSQILLVVPPDKGYGAEGQTSAGIKGTDTLVFVVDILDAS